MDADELKELEQTIADLKVMEQRKAKMEELKQEIEDLENENYELESTIRGLIDDFKFYGGKTELSPVFKI